MKQDNYFGKRIVYHLVIIFLLSSFTNNTRPKFKSSIKNFHQVSEDLYRSAQFKKRGVKQLQHIGISTIINMRTMHNDNSETSQADFNIEHLPINTGKMSEDDLLRILRVFQESEKPVLIHCWHGSDRTGAVVAIYRTVYQNWNKEDAVNEMKKFGYHEKWFPHLRQLVLDLDVEKFRQELGLN